MGKLTNILCFLLSLLAFAACSDESADDGPKKEKLVPMTFQTSFADGSEETRACLGADDATLWQDGDKISLLSVDGDINPVNLPFNLTGGAGTSYGTFSGLGYENRQYVSVYPYKEGMQVGVEYSSVQSAASHVMLPNVQQATKGTFDRNAMIQISKLTDKSNTLKFRNVGGMLELNPAFDCTSITVEGGSGAVLSGMTTAEFPLEADYPSAEAENNQGASLAVLYGDIKADSKYYLYVLPFTSNVGVRVTYRNGSKAVSRVVESGGLTLERAHIKSIPRTSASLPAASELVDLGLSVLWSSRNIGADSETQKGYRYAWGELAPKQGYESSNHMFSGSANLTATDDIASILSGGAMRMPTKEEYEELVNNCTWTYEPENKGYRVTSKKTGFTDRSIFLPFVDIDMVGSYWSSTYDASKKGAYKLLASVSPRYNEEQQLIGYDYTFEALGDYSYQAAAVRPVAAK